jgi:hypothetical protein
MNLELKIIIWNAKGFKDKINEFNAFTIKIISRIILINDTQLYYKITVKLPNYFIYRTNNISPTNGKTHSGTAISVRRNVVYR